MAATSVPIPPEDFLKAIWGESPGIAELGALDHRVKVDPYRSFSWTYPGSFDGILTSARRHNKESSVYMGVCLRREQWPRKNKAGKKEKRGTEENTLSAGTIWCEVDFTGDGHKGGRTTTPEELRSRLSTFPLQPSIIVRSGGGVHIYWLLKELAIGDDLARVKAANQGVAHALGADDCSDLARILRIPGLVNHKYNPPRPVDVSRWKPELRYSLSDFDAFPPPPDKKKTAPAAVAPAPELHNVQPTHPPESTPVTLADGDLVKIRELLGKIWMDGHRHKLAMAIGGFLARACVDLDQAKSIVEYVSDAVQGNTQNHVHAVETSYERFAAGEPVVGGPTIEREIEEMPELIRPNLKKIWTILKKLIPRPPKPPNKDTKADFELVKLIKYDSRPAKYTATLKMLADGKEAVVTAETPNFLTFYRFREAVFEQADLLVANIKQGTWERLVSSAKLELVEAPPEASANGAIDSGVDEFLTDKHENPDLGELNTFPGYDEQAIYFKLVAFKGFLRDQGIRTEDRSICHRLKVMGWKSGTRRVGEDVVRVWSKAALTNGHKPPAAPDLFQAPDKVDGVTP
jgi:hypothetical protein